jgi:hypothetical protein
MPLRLGLSELDLERHLLRKTVGRLAEARPHCRDCGRTPLTGEVTYLLPRGGFACALCRPRHRGDLAAEVVLGAERGQTVRLRAA